MNHNKLLLGANIAVLFIVVLFATGTVMYLDQGRELKAAQNQIQELQTECANLKQKLEDKDREIGDLRKSSDAINEELKAQIRKTNTTYRSVQSPINLRNQEYEGRAAERGQSPRYPDGRELPPRVPYRQNEDNQ